MTKNSYRTNRSEFLGILEGKAKARKAAAEAAAAVAIEEAKRDTLIFQALTASKGYDPGAASNEFEITKAQIALDETKADATSETTRYIILAVVVMVVMVGLYFSIKKK